MVPVVPVVPGAGGGSMLPVTVIFDPILDFLLEIPGRLSMDPLLVVRGPAMVVEPGCDAEARAVAISREEVEAMLSRLGLDSRMLP